MDFPSNQLGQLAKRWGRPHMALLHETEVSDAVPKAQHRTLTIGLTITAQQFLNSHFLR
jgi:hypothetical protein